MYTRFVRPILFQLSTEKAHHLTVKAGETVCAIPGSGRLLCNRYSGRWPSLSRELMGIRFSNPVGLAAGFDKNASCPRLIRALGFGFTEFGSITAKASNGNPAPRLFRLRDDHALINRMGLNNDGAEVICRRIASLRQKKASLFQHFPFGINIAKTHDPAITGDDAVRDYLTSYEFAKHVADYITLNISCPNTNDGKTFEDKHALTDLLEGIRSVRTEKDPPLLVKFSPDMELSHLEELVSACEDRDINGYVLTNTSSKRNGLRAPESTLKEMGPGGLSGSPLFNTSLLYVRHLRKILARNKVLAGCGGIDSPGKAVEMMKAGADLLQVYTGLVYQGPGLIPSINNALAALPGNHSPDSYSR